MREFEETVTIVMGVFVIVVITAFCIAVMSRLTEVEVQEIKPVENGYIITIDNKVYYKEKCR